MGNGFETGRHYDAQGKEGDPDMSIPDRDEFWGYMATRNDTAEHAGIKYAHVARVTSNRKAHLIFAGEELPSQKAYPRLKSCDMAAGDFVILVNNLIIGVVDTNA